MTSSKDVELVITRTINAPRSLVWKMWSEAEHLARWWGPKGMTIRIEKLEFRPGGLFHYAMGLPNGQEMWGRFVYGDMSPEESFSFINSFSDPLGSVTRAPFSPVWPLEVSNTITLEDKGDTTIQTLRGAPINANDIELATFKVAHLSMQNGFGGTFDQLDEYLKTL